MKLNIVKSVIMAGAMLSISTVAQAADVTLTMAHFLSPKAPPHAKFLEPWAKKIEAESGGRIKIEIFPSMTLGGKPPELYRQLRDGAADIVWTLTGYTPGVFPRTEVFELPGVHQGSAEATSLAIQDEFALIAEDFKDIKPLLVHVHAGQAIHLVNGCVDGVAGLKGMKLRTPSRTGGWMISSWGAEPVGMPVPALPQALSKGVVDGALIPFEIVPPFKVHELTKCSIVGANGSRFGTSVFLFAMNKDRYESLPADLKAIIDANSGTAIAGEAGKLWDAIETPGQKLQEKTGSPVKMLDQAATDGFSALTDQVTAKWVEEATAAGIDAKALVTAAKAAVAKHTK
ncbi:TRAP transporter substrate-binding protein [Nisaea acidiphila]|uniref:TRAP transporter substrate-binding protein n=1 Tax=Nisaea acidiphila TaxID=1862145 RepID=A0A9J7AQ41_9PROT|nr:TRAP transporter substrate-binding protein [Nisaea acidiphila]UUX48476.1 TRAP transporter substrate-binding protein [Nisaea acidiphila]